MSCHLSHHGPWGGRALCSGQNLLLLLIRTCFFYSTTALQWPAGISIDWAMVRKLMVSPRYCSVGNYSHQAGYSVMCSLCVVTCDVWGPENLEHQQQRQNPVTDFNQGSRKLQYGPYEAMSHIIVYQIKVKLKNQSHKGDSGICDNITKRILWYRISALVCTSLVDSNKV